jgi:hypothetical protein
VRVARVPGTENVSPTAPALTQTDEIQWEIPLAQALITTAGVITITNEREFTRTALARAGAFVEIETITSDGSLQAMDFQDIPQIFKHLFITGKIFTSLGGATGTTTIILNDDTVVANYSREVLARTVGSLQSQGSLNFISALRTRSTTQLASLFSMQFSITISNYKNTIFYKNIHNDETNIMNNTVADFSISTEIGIWLNTNAVNRVTLQGSAGAVLEVGSEAVLYGIR